ncbi:MAG TPA: phosphoribosylglycinamide formyltransferase [Balneolales bacterium]|nr:phosphoribosylglycinamide formyltransferase [Balneolales bacterium]
MKKIVVFASGSGTNFQAIIDTVVQKSIHAEITGLITDNPDAAAIKRAQKNGIPFRVLRSADYNDYQAYIFGLLNQLNEWKPDLIVLAGYLKKIPVEVIRLYENRIINIHPALLPKYGGKGFYGMNVHRAVIAAGEKESGCTVHIVTEEYDKGPILAQMKVPVKKDDRPETLQQRILKQEHRLLPQVINKLLTQKQS